MLTPLPQTTSREGHMTPTDGHLHHLSRTSVRAERHVEQRPDRHVLADRRSKTRRQHGRLTLAESPDLYMREEMI